MIVHLQVHTSLVIMRAQVLSIQGIFEDGGVHVFVSVRPHCLFRITLRERCPQAGGTQQDECATMNTRASLSILPVS